MARDMGIENSSVLRKQELIFALLNEQTKNNEPIFYEGVLEILPDGFGFLRAPDYNYLAWSRRHLCVSLQEIRRFSLRTGDTVSGQIRPPKDNERYFALPKVETINFEEPEATKQKILFDNLTPLYPDQRLVLEYHPKNYSTRIIDLLSPNRKRSARTDCFSTESRQEWYYFKISQMPW